MHWLENQLQNAPPPDTIVHLGAGLCRELELWRKSGARRIVLVEPNPELLPELRLSVREGEPVEIIAAAVAGQSGRESFRLFNFPMLSSLREPTGLYRILPGLTQIGRVMVETRTLEQLLNDLDLPAEGEHWLVIDTPGEEMTVIDQLRQSGGLHRFARAFLNAGIEPMYEGAETVQELLRLLQAQGFEPVGQPDLGDADWPRHHLRLDRMALECQRLKAELAEQKQWEHEYKADLEAVHNSLRTVEQVLAESERLHQAQLAEAEERLQTTLAEARQAHHSELEATKAAAQKELASLQQTSVEKVDQLERALMEGEKSLAEAEQATVRTQSELEQSTQQLEEKTRILTSLQSENENLHKEIAAAREELQQQKGDLGIALRLQALRENDLRELQQRYGQMSQVNEQQRELLGKLHQRLSVAAEYLALTEKSTDQPDQIREELTRALTGMRHDVD